MRRVDIGTSRSALAVNRTRRIEPVGTPRLSQNQSWTNLGEDPQIFTHCEKTAPVALAQVSQIASEVLDQFAPG